MKTYNYIGLVGLAAASLFATQAFAIACPTAPATGTQTKGSPVCIAPVGQDGSGTGLANILSTYNATTNPNGIVLSGPTYDPYTQQQAPSGLWSIGATGASEDKITLEIAGNANSNTFGIFDPTDPSKQLQLFSGPASAGATTTLINNGGGSYTAFYLTGQGPTTTKTASFGTTNLFGYYLSGPGGTFYSKVSLNQDPGSIYANGTPHMVAYDGNNSTALRTSNSTGTGTISGLFLSNEYLLAWEDQSYLNSDLDYNDFVILVESVHPVPEPAVLGMFGLGMLLIGGFAGMRRRREEV